MENLIYIIFVFALAGLVKGVTGLGLPTLSMALLTLVMPPMQAAGLLIVPSLLTNGWQLLSGGPVYPLWERLRPMMLGICLGTLAGGLLLRHSGMATATLGLALVAYALMNICSLQWKVAEHDEHWLSPLTGAMTGVLCSATGVFVLPAVPYLQAIGLRKDQLVQAMGMAFTVSTMALAVSLAAQDAWQPELAGMSFVAQLPALAGMWAGQRIRRRMDPLLFRKCLLAVFLLTGVYLTVKGIT
jgi:uncharacterized membrane protein YfcA